MAVPAKITSFGQESPADLRQPLKELTPLQELAARMYADGHSRQRIARYLERKLITKAQAKRPGDQRLLAARSRLRAWEGSASFRDAVWRYTVEKADRDSPAIVAGVVKSAKKGRVDAARLALEITGRHDPKGDATPTQVAIVFTGVPRPQAVVEEVEGEAVEL